MGNFEKYMRFEFNIIFSNYFAMYLLLYIVNFYLFTIFSKMGFSLYACKLNLQTVYFVYET